MSTTTTTAQTYTGADLRALNGTLGVTLVAYREARNFSQAQFARAIGMDISYYNRIERGRCPLGRVGAERIASAMRGDVAAAPTAAVPPARVDSRSLWQQARDVEQENARLRAENTDLRARLAAIAGAIRSA